MIIIPVFLQRSSSLQRVCAVKVVMPWERWRPRRRVPKRKRADARVPGKAGSFTTFMARTPMQSCFLANPPQM